MSRLYVRAWIFVGIAGLGLVALNLLRYGR